MYVIVTALALAVLGHGSAQHCKWKCSGGEQLPVSDCPVEAAHKFEHLPVWDVIAIPLSVRNIALHPVSASTGKTSKDVPLQLLHVKHPSKASLLLLRAAEAERASGVVHKAARNVSLMDMWTQVWATSHILGELFLGMPAALDGLAMLELGSGSGVAGLSAAIATACSPNASITLSDVSGQAVNMLRSSVALNCLDGHAFAQITSWNKFPSRDMGRYDIVFASDVLFTTDHCRPIAVAISAALKPGGIGIIADPFRPSSKAFDDESRDAGLLVLEARLFDDCLFASGLLLKRLKIWILGKPTSHSIASDNAEVGRVVQALRASLDILSKERCNWATEATQTGLKFTYVNKFEEL